METKWNRCRKATFVESAICLFPLKDLLEKNENTTLASIERAELTSEPETLSAKDTYFLKTGRKRAITRKDLVFNQSEINQCLLTILEDTIDQVHIISYGKKYDDAIAEFNETLDEKVAKQFLYDPIFDHVSCDPYPLHFTKQKLSKVLMDCSGLNQILALMRSEIKEENTLKCIRTVINNIIHRRNEELQLLKEEMENFNMLKERRDILENEHRETQRYLDEIKNRLNDTIDQTDVLLFENILREKYVNDWEKARREQNNILCTRAEDKLQRNIDTCNHEIDTEMRVASEEEAYLLEVEQDLKKNIRVWSERLVREIDQHTLDNQKIKELLDDTQKNYEELNRLYEKHKNRIRVYIELKNRRSREFEMREKRRKAAIKIQAWWRGTMVRNHLGRFRLKGKRRKGKGKGKGKKGKKGKKK